MDEFLQVLMGYDWGGDRNALAGITTRVAQAHGDAAQCAELEGQLLTVLESEAPLPAKEFVCRQLALIGTAQSVPALTRMLANDTTNDMARMALEQIPDGAASAALRDALPNLSGLQRIGTATSLGQRRDAGAVAALCGLLADPDLATVIAAAEALGQIAGADAAEGLARAKATATGGAQRPILDAYLRCADQCAVQGDAGKARAIYTEMQEEAMPKPIREAAAQGLKRLTAEGTTA